ncbi:MAG TPA: hypothetical protein VFS30_08125 [Dehalococcoidia bacterium]|nr:hypothetical protein [Dehalococcoidia bacterium]
MTTDDEYEVVIKAAEMELKQAKTADEVRDVWRKHSGSLGHRTLGRLLTGQSAEKLLDRRADRA